MKKKPIFLIAAAKSGAGKTTLTLGVLAALVRQGYKVQPFKCGPDFIDPTLHKLVTGNLSYNLDLKMMGPACCREIFYEKGKDADILVIEGVMGLFDGGSSSTAEVAKALGIPIFLVIDAQSCAESAVAVLRGFEVFDPLVKIAGVIFNKIGSERHRELIHKAALEHTDVPVIGYMPRDSHFTIPERHLGLFMGAEKPLNDEQLTTLTDTIEKHLDINVMLAESSQSLFLPQAKNSPPPARKPLKRLAIASDEAFCFYYPQNLELLSQHGFKLIPFSPVHDSQLPDNLEMIYFGGGYPENFADLLSKNHSMLDQVRKKFSQGIPIYGECGGFMYLCDSLMDNDNHLFQMVGVFPFRAVMNRRLRRLGYREVTLQRDCLLGNQGDVLHGHEFHYSDIDKSFSAEHSKNTLHLYELDNNSHEGYSIGSAVGSYVHLHFANTPNAIEHMYRHLTT